MTAEAWIHEPPCPQGGFTEVSRFVARKSHGICPLCGTALTPPPDIVAARKARERRHQALTEAWLRDRPTPQEIVAMATTGRTLAEVRNRWWVDPSLEPLAEGSRGGGERRGQIGLGLLTAGIYPACSRHGAANRVGQDPSIWRCLAEGCNAGAIWRAP